MTKQQQEELLTLAAWKAVAYRLALALRDNIMDRRDNDECCDWSCSLCAPIAKDLEIMEVLRQAEGDIP